MTIFSNDSIKELCRPYFDRLAENLKNNTDLDREIRDLIDAFLKVCLRTYPSPDIFLKKLKDYADKNEIKDISRLFEGKLYGFAHFLLGDEWAGYLVRYMYLVAESPYTEGLDRRSIRSRLVDLHLNENLLQDIKNFVILKATGFPTSVILRGGRNQKEVKALRLSFETEPWLSVKLDMADPECMDFLLEAMSSENNFNRMGFHHFKAIAKSANPRLLEAEGKLLLAARLQEGLRQAIVETMDEGRPQSLMHMLGVIRDNNLQRFASVKRAMAVITGLPEQEWPKRITDKLLDLMWKYLTDRQLATAAVGSRDAMEVYLALWALACHDVTEIERPIESLISEGPAYLAEAAALLLLTVEYPSMSKRMAHTALRLRLSDHGLMAGLLLRYLSEMKLYLNLQGEPTPTPPLKDFFKSREDAEQDFNSLVSLLESMKGDETFEPYVFPWLRINLRREDVALIICKLALLLRDAGHIDQPLTYLKYLESDMRAGMIRHLLSCPQTGKQKDYVIEAMTDRAWMPQEAACRIVKRLHENHLLDENDYLRLEDHLRLKASGMRITVIDILSSRQSNEIKDTITRLLGDRNADRRLAGLDIFKKLIANSEHPELHRELLEAVNAVFKPTSKEKVLIEDINTSLKSDAVEFSKENGFGLYNPNDELRLNTTFPEYVDIPGSMGFEDENRPVRLIEGIIRIIEEHGDDTFVNDSNEETKLCLSAKRDVYGDGVNALAFPELWEEYYRREIGSHTDMLKLYLWLHRPEEMYAPFFKTLERILGKDYFRLEKTFTGSPSNIYRNQVRDIIEGLFETFGPSSETISMAADVLSALADEVRSDELTLKFSKYSLSHDGFEDYKEHGLFEVAPFSILTNLLRNHSHETDDELFVKSFQARYALYRNTGYKESFRLIDPMEYLRLWKEGYMTDSEFWHEMLGRQSNTAILKEMTQRQEWPQISYRGQKYSFPVTPEETRLVMTAVDRVLDIELRRGDTPTPVTGLASVIRVVRGVDSFVRILQALGKIKPVSYFCDMVDRKQYVLSGLLHVSQPAKEDTPRQLLEACRNAGITERQLVEAAMFSPKWLNIVEEAIGWEGLTSGAYWFLAHTAEYLYNSVKSQLPRFTTISPEDFADGAFDPVWFKEVYETLGPERFETVYNAAKFISTGNRHTRSRKLSDAVLGKLRLEETEQSILEKRNKDSVVAYGLIPIQPDRTSDLRRRYRVLNTFLKGSKEFGSQRQASEKRAVELSLDNLARSACFGDAMRLKWSMEADMIKEAEFYLQPHTVEDTTLYIGLTDGIPEIIAESKGKRLISIPLRIKKDKYVEQLKDIHTRLKQQHSRGREQLEDAMNNESSFSGEEILALKDNPVIWELLSRLVLTDGRGHFGMPDKDGARLIDATGEPIPITQDEMLRIAHPFDMYKAGVWRELQSMVYEKKIRQPFKQVFRELYVPTEDEFSKWKSLRFAGNQIMPQKAAAILKKRRWVVDHENGLVKTDHHGDVTAILYAMADWFSPADIEAPTLEYVAFHHRRSFKEMMVSDINPITFSEIMRDVDLAVSVAHAGGVNPETSHSTLEMRRMILEHSLPMFGFTNVEISGNFAKLKGQLATYHIHLGSGVVHKEGGTQIAVVPVHSQSRGRIFLPCLDEDPKTAEILSKVLLFADDTKIKDPAILSQI